MKSFLTLFTSFILISQSSSKVIIPLHKTENQQNDLAVTSSDGKLIFAHVIFRHGARNPSRELYPNDPYKDKKHWPEGFEQLTNEGKLQQYNLGKYFRRRYNQLLDAKYTPEKVYVQSTDVDRTLMSAQANLAGLFEPIKEEKWHKSIMWQPIPVHTVPKKMDYVLKGGKKCRKYKAAFKKYIKESDEIQRIYREYEADFKFWSEMSGSKLETIEEVNELYKILFTENYQKKTLPDWGIKAIETNGRMEFIAVYFQSMATATPLLARLKSGFLLKEILQHFSEKIDATMEPDDRTLWLYSGHEHTIANMLTSLGIFENHIPPYASSLHFELYKTDEDEYYIQIFYRKSDEENPLAINIPGCGEKCSLNELYDIYDEIIPGDFDSECEES